MRVENTEQALTLTQEALLSPQGEPARRSLRAAADNIGRDVTPEWLRALVARLAGRWRQARGTERARASDALWSLRSDALWSLRSYLPPRLRLQLALYRSPPLVLVALPLAGALVAALVFGLILWGPRFLTPRPETDWVDVPAGEFLMGSNPEVDPNASGGEMPQHAVYVDAFRISKYEITNAQYAQCVRATVCEDPGETAYYEDPNYADHPVFYVSWSDAQTFCTWVGGRLPTEAEWEYAARGPEGRTYPWGNDPPTCARAQFGECEGGTVPVGSYPDGASWCGAEDMAGNVWEWVADWYGNYPPTSQTNPTGSETGTYKVLRGGGRNDNWYGVRAAYRYYNPDPRYFSVGFRCAGVAPGR